MAKRDLKDTVENQYFKRESIPVAGEEGTREMNPLLPFIISGGKNTERYYFKHISHITPFKFNIKPEYFGDESQYNVRFSEIVDEILRRNGEDSRIFCVFDLDTIIGNKTRENSLKEFEKRVKGKATLCPSMPSIEYWFLLHFEDCCELLKDWSDISQKLAPYIRSYFPDSHGVSLKKLLKSEKHVKDSAWVEELCKDGKLELAVSRAEKNIEAARNAGTLEDQSYSFVYLVFKNY